MNYQVDEKGFYGEFGGAFIPEMLYPNIEELRLNYLKITAEPSFKKEFMDFSCFFNTCSSIKISIMIDIKQIIYNCCVQFIRLQMLWINLHIF